MATYVYRVTRPSLEIEAGRVAATVEGRFDQYYAYSTAAMQSLLFWLGLQGATIHEVFIRSQVAETTFPGYVGITH
jgi:hypothetical protein